MKSLIFIAFLTLQSANYAWACGCSHPQSIESMHGEWSFAFVGRVESVERTEEKGVISEVVMFDVINNITDVKDGKAKVLFRKGGTSCDLEEPNFKIGEIYTLTMSKRIDVNLYYNNYCDLRARH